jgi:dTDP-4-amino-4,6-dideoxygalactose transaminase
MAKDYEMPGDIRTWGVYVPDDAIKRVTEVLRTGWLNTGKNEKLLRETFCKKFNAPYCIAVNNGTAALRATYSMLGIGPGDEVVTTPYTFIATNTAILEQGATPVFADVRYDDLNVTAESIEKKLTKKTKAIVVVHYAGNPVDLDEIREVAMNYDLPLIEDSAHAIGSKYKGKYIGETGEFVTFSLQAVKIITAGDGGLIVTNDEDNYNALKKKVWYGIDRDNKQSNLFYDPLPQDIDALGFKYNMNDIIASLGISAINNFEKPFEWRKYIGTAYRRELGDLFKVHLLNYYPDREPNYQIFPIHVYKRREFAQFMWDNGIQVVVNNRRNDKYSIFGGKQRELINLDRVDKDVILLPIHYDLSDTDMNKIIDKVREYDKL